MARALLVAAVLWPALLAGAAWQRVTGEPAWWPAAVYYAASQVCHQRPERSFHTAGVAWPVCGRCSGLYLAAPLGGLLAVGIAGRRVRGVGRRWLRAGLAVAALPTVLTLGLEWFDLAPISNLMRFAAALPLGLAVACAIVLVADPAAGSNRVH
jgi:uncharacterized membrane protein